MLRASALVGRRRPALRADAAGARRRALCGQGLVVLAAHRPGALARRHAQPGPRVAGRARAAEDEDRRRAGRARRLGAGHRPPVAADQPTATAGSSSRRAARTSPTTARRSRGPGRIVNIEDYERTLYPGLVDRYEEQGYCWVVVGSTQRGRAEVEPEAVPRALAYYRELERRADTAYVASPYRAGAGPVDFNFDWSFDFYPLAYHRPGPDDDGSTACAAARCASCGRRALGALSSRAVQRTETDHEHLSRAIELAARGRRPRASQPGRGRGGRQGRRGPGRGLARRVRRPARRGQRDRRLRRRRPRAARRSTSRWSRAATTGKTPPCTDAILDAGHRARGRRLRRPDREGLRPRPGDPARRGRDRRRRRRRARRARPARQPGLPQARAHAAGRGCCSSRR